MPPAITSCPNCMKTLNAFHQECPDCGFPLPAAASGQGTVPTPTPTGTGIAYNPNLAACSACGHQISRQARVCPSCGQPNGVDAARRGAKATVIVYATLLLAIIATCGAIWVRHHSEHPLVGAWHQSEEVVSGGDPNGVSVHETTYVFEPDGTGHLDRLGKTNWMQLRWVTEGENHVVISFVPGPTAQWTDWNEHWHYSISDDGQMLTIGSDTGSMLISGMFRRVK